MKRIFLFLFIPMVFMLIASPAIAATYYVNHDGTEDFTEIQPALNAAANGDTIIVRDGKYTGANNKNLDFGGKAITLRSESVPKNCIIDCENDGRGFNFHSGETNTSLLTGFAIINGDVTTYTPFVGGGIRCDNASPTISNCVIMNNVAESSGGGISCLNNSSPAIFGCIIRRNYADAGGGVYCGMSSSPMIDGCYISDNSAETGGGIDVFYSSAPTIRNCSITGNTISYNGGGVDCYDATATLTNCTIAGNTSTEGWGGGIMCHTLSSVTVVNCILWGNSVPTFGDQAAIYIDGALDVSYSDVQNEALGVYVEEDGVLVWGPGNFGSSVTDRPRFVSNGDFHLRGNSPCIDRGTSTSVLQDIDGETRPNDLAHDVGSDEYYPPEIALGPSTLVNSCLQGQDAPPQTFDVWNSGSGTLFYSITDDSDWLYCIPTNGEATDETDRNDVVYDTSSLGVGTHYATITITDKYATTDPQQISVELTVIPNLTQISLISPADLSILNSPPTFAWDVDGGSNNAFVVDFRIPGLVQLWTSPVISPATWTMPSSVWNAVPSGRRVYWRVRGADLDVEPMTIITSDEVWSFMKE